MTDRRHIIATAALILTACIPSGAQRQGERLAELTVENRRLLALVDSLEREVTALRGDVFAHDWTALKNIEPDEEETAEASCRPAPQGGVLTGERLSSEDERLAAGVRLSAPFLIIPFRKEVRDYIDFYLTRRKRSLPAILGRYDRYNPQFLEAFRRHGIPDEITALCIIETAVSPRALSPVGAAGMWQLMPKTARSLGLRVDESVDERYDVTKSTETAALFLASAYRQLGDWPLAVCSYNCGIEGVRKACIRSGGRTDYWGIHSYLPKETQGYLLSLLAVCYIKDNREALGIRTRAWHGERTVAMAVTERASLDEIARGIGIDAARIRKLNPELVGGTAEAGTTIRIPAKRISE